MSGLNHYAYCSANPIKYTDPTGLTETDDPDGDDDSDGTKNQDDEDWVGNKSNDDEKKKDDKKDENEKKVVNLFFDGIGGIKVKPSLMEDAFGKYKPPDSYYIEPFDRDQIGKDFGRVYASYLEYEKENAIKQIEAVLGDLDKLDPNTVFNIIGYSGGNAVGKLVGEFLQEMGFKIENNINISNEYSDSKIKDATNILIVGTKDEITILDLVDGILKQSALPYTNILGLQMIERSFYDKVIEVKDMGHYGDKGPWGSSNAKNTMEVINDIINKTKQ